MPLQESKVNINFAQGLDLKTDPFQVQAGKFLDLQNTIFTKGGLLQKRNGFKQLPTLPDTSSKYLTTFKGNLTALGESLQALSQGNSVWLNKGNTQPVNLSVMPLARSSFNQTQGDAVVSSNGLICCALTEVDNGSNSFKYAILDQSTGQSIVPPTSIAPSGPGVVFEAPRVFALGSYFIILFSVNNGGAHNLQYLSININTPLSPNIAVAISSSYIPSLGTQTAYDAVVASNNYLYIVWNDSNGGSHGVNSAYLSSNLVLSSTQIITSTYIADVISICADDTNMSSPVIWVSFYDSTAVKLYTLAVSSTLTPILALTTLTTSGVTANIATVASGARLSILYEVVNNYGYDSSIPTNFIKINTVTQAGSVGTSAVTIRSLGLASKAFLYVSDIYYLAAYNSNYQPTYFLMKYSGSSPSKVIAKLAYSNGGGYVKTALPCALFDSLGNVNIAYLFKDLVTAVNKTQGVTASTGVYAQTGINLSSFNLNTVSTSTEIGNNLHLSGGFLWAYDGNIPVEHNFHLWPDNVETSPANSGGGMLAQEYFYQAIYQWTDLQGNLFYSAPSVPVSATVKAGSGLTFTSVFSAGDTVLTVSSVSGLFVGQVIVDNTTGSNLSANTFITAISGSTITLNQPTAGSSAGSPGDTLATTQQGEVIVNVPTLRLTYKTLANNSTDVKIILYRWSAAQQNYYQVTSITAPLLNDTTIDYVSFTDKQSDYAIQGNGLIYTTGGVVEDIAAPSTSIMALYKSRLFLVDSEDTNLVWYSKQVIEGTPVEMSDLFTIFIAPTISAQGNTGPITALSALDDKLIIFKKNAIYYITGTGPDNTGASNDFSDPIYITGTVGCTNQNSIVLMPQGLMFQSDKGIWLLGRDLSTNYIGAPVEQFNSNTATSALTIPGTNQVRFGMNNGTTLMYDYYYGQWGTFTGIPSISGSLYLNLHTFINSFGQVFQENPGSYQDGANAVLIKFTTSWFNLSGLQGYQRAKFFYMLGKFISPHTLTLQIAYDYNPSATQSSTYIPYNFSGTWGSESLWGGGPSWGGYTQIEQERIFLQQQKCQSFQLTLIESYDSSHGTPPGAGFTMSGIDLAVSGKDTKPRLPPNWQVG